MSEQQNEGTEVAAQSATPDVSPTAEQGDSTVVAGQTEEQAGTEVPSGDPVPDAPVEEIKSDDGGPVEDVPTEGGPTEGQNEFTADAEGSDAGSDDKPEWNVETHGPAPKGSEHLYNVVGG